MPIVFYVFFLDLQCWVQGRCQGVLIDEVPVLTGNDCMDLCKADSNCLWFTYNSLDNACTLLQDCQQLDPACGSCLTGQRQCSAQKGVVILGYLLVIDISNQFVLYMH